MTDAANSDGSQPNSNAAAAVKRANKSIRDSIASARSATRGGGSGSGGDAGGGATGPDRKRLQVLRADLPATAREVRDLLSRFPDIFDRGGPVRIAPGAAAWYDIRDRPIIRPLTVHDVVNMTHQAAQPWRWRRAGEKFEEEEVTLPERVANLFLAMQGAWNLRPLRGVTTAPLLFDDGSIQLDAGYDRNSHFWCVPPLVINVLSAPTRAEASEALAYLRDTFCTFPFADSERVIEDGVQCVDRTKPPGADESAALMGLATAVCRASMDFGPGLAITAPNLSGAGAGKGLLARAFAEIALGISPSPFTPGGERGELEKRLAAELIAGGQIIFLDNANGAALQSDALASVLTESPVRVRVLGESRMVELDGRVWIVVAGNGLRIGEDLARRMLLCELDPKCEDPETRPFAPGFLKWIKDVRFELLAHVLTIWRWGRQNRNELQIGLPLGTFETWTSWVRDPLLTLGCRDPVARLAEIKAGDPSRIRASELFDVWWRQHGETPMRASELAEPVLEILDPHKRGRQFQASQLQRLKDTRTGNYVFTAERAGGNWSVTIYVLQRTDQAPDGALAGDVDGVL